MKHLLLALSIILLTACGQVPFFPHQGEWANKVCSTNGGVGQLFIEIVDPMSADDAFARVYCKNGAEFFASNRQQMESFGKQY